MSKNKLGKALFATLLLAAATQVLAQALPVPRPAKAEKPGASTQVGVVELRQMANQAYYSKDYRAFKNAMFQLHQQRPNNSEYMYQLVLAYALLDEKSEAFNVMLQMQRQGLSYDFTKSPDSQNLQGTQLFDHLNRLMMQAGEPLGNVESELVLKPEMVLPEAIEWDSQREAFLIGTVRDGTITAVSLDGTHKELLRADDQNGIWGIFGLVVDAKNNRLWASSASSPQFAGFDPVDKGRSALLELDLTSMELIKRYPVPVDGRPHNLGNLVIAPNGDIYVSDSMLPIVYVKKAEETRLKPFYGSPGMVSLRGLAISDDGRNLYVADYEMGIAVIDIENGNPYLLGTPETLNLGGIDGLIYWQGHLVIIQNGISPQRVMRLALNDNGRAVTTIAPLVVALDIMDFPNYGTVVEDQLYFFANSHWGSSDENLTPVTIAATSVADVPVLIDQDAERIIRNYKAALKAGMVEVVPGLSQAAAQAEQKAVEEKEKRD